VGGLRFVIHPSDHEPPHFHVESQRVSASFRIDNCDVFAGSLSPADFRTVCYWHQRSRLMLEECWTATRPTDCVTGRGA
jgi:hypothetical protein